MSFAGAKQATEVKRGRGGSQRNTGALARVKGSRGQGDKPHLSSFVDIAGRIAYWGKKRRQVQVGMCCVCRLDGTTRGRAQQAAGRGKTQAQGRPAGCRCVGGEREA